MPVFEYTALDRRGRSARGSIDASTLREAKRRLRAERVHVLSIGRGLEAGRPAARREIRLRSGRVTPADLAAGTRQLATLLRAGMAVAPALDALVEQSGASPMARVLADVRDRVREGATFAAALGAHPAVFSQVFVNMVETGESAGALEAVLDRLAEMLERRRRLANKVKAAMTYPALMVAVAVFVVAFLMGYVVPGIGRLFLEMNRDLPPPTVALIGVGEFLAGYWWALAGAFAAAWAAFRAWVRTPPGRLAWDGLKLKTPLVGDLVRKTAVARFARTLGALLASNVPILTALAIVKPLVGNKVIERSLEKASEEIRQGESIAEPLRKSGVFPPIVYHMVAVGERSGNVEARLLNVAEAFEDEIEMRVVALTSIIEPAMILVTGVVVGFIVIAVLLPIFEINQAIR